MIRINMLNTKQDILNMLHENYSVCNNFSEIK